MNIRAIVLASATFLAVLAPASQAGAHGAVAARDTIVGTPPAAPAARLARHRTKVTTLANEARGAAGLAPLAVNAQLTTSAQRYAEHLAADGAFSHTDGSVLTDRVAAVGYAYHWVGENLGLGQRHPAGIVRAWMASPEHRANLLDPRFREVGIGIAVRPDGLIVWCMDLGEPR